MTEKTSSKPSPLMGFIYHLHPRTVPEYTLRFTLSFGLGGMAATLCFILFLTGILQLLSYSADTATAYQSIIDMYAGSSPAGFVRNIHHWSGNLLVIVVVLHLLRVFLTGAIDTKRRFNWLIGIGLLLLILFGNFTGYLLPWDQLAYWAVTIFTNMIDYIPLIGPWLSQLLRGGGEVGPATLSNFFAIHIGLIPALLVILLVYHFWMIRKAGGLIHPTDSDRSRIKTVPGLISKEAAVGLGLTALVFLFSALVEAPLAEMANPGESPNPAKAAWYFMGLQELLLHFHPTFAISIIPFLMLVLLALIPFFPDTALSPGVWCGGRQGRLRAAISFVTGLLVTFPVVFFDEKLLRAGQSQATESSLTWLNRGVIPLLVITLLYYATYLLLRKKKNYLRSECFMTLLLFSLGIICGLTLIGIWFRGSGMTLGFYF